MLPYPNATLLIRNVVSRPLISACAELSGYRNWMEDAHSMIHSPGGTAYFFGVFDGHGGNRCSNIVSQTLPKTLLDVEAPFDENEITRRIVEIDRKVCEETADGSCATFSLLWPQDIHSSTDMRVLVGNLGDSRIIKGSFDHEDREDLTYDHKPDLPQEKKRIEKAGGHIAPDGDIWRTCGNLALSRAFGDRQYKDVKLPPQDQIISNVPDYKRTTLRHNEFLVLACDGVFERKLTNTDVAAIARKLLRETNNASDAAGAIVMSALQGGSTDNISCMVVWNNAEQATALMKEKGENTKDSIVEFGEMNPGPVLSTRSDFLMSYYMSALRCGQKMSDFFEMRF
eukprot:PhF_6_TR21640/c0_g1_i1/m.30805/K04461/PPM1B, PP2CB; protein phosphatase 1B